MPLSYRFPTAILTVYSFGVVHHIPEIEVVLAEINRVETRGMVQLAVYHLFSIHTLSLFLRAILNFSIFELACAACSRP